MPTEAEKSKVEKEKPHTHHRHPSRCCAAEPAQDVLDRLRSNRPTRLGYPAHGGWSGESEDAFATRVRAWTDAVKREEDYIKKGIGE